MDESSFIAIIKEALGGYPLSPAIAHAIKFMFMNRYESMAIINQVGEIEFLDRLSEKAFGVTHGTVRGRQIREIIPSSGLPDVLQTGMPHIGKIFNVKGRQRIVSRFPVFCDERPVSVFGRVLLVSLEELERVRHESQRLRNKVITVQEKILGEHQATYVFDNILGTSAKIRQTKSLAMKMADSDADVLIYGESGTGKELFAHAIHSQSSRSTKPFVKVNCPAIPIELAESELFGYEKGAFTGARKAGKLGKFELAQGGTIFLDEIGSLPISIQSKLLRVIQEREIERLGSQKLIRLNIRVIAASNIDLKIMVDQAKFRDDLLYRLSKAVLKLPPLRERPEDIPTYLSNYLNVIGRNIRISNEVLVHLIKYSWPGNVRELINILEQSNFRASPNEEIRLTHLPEEIKANDNSLMEEDSMSAGSLRSRVEETEKKSIAEALRISKRNKRKAAQYLGIQRSLLYNKMKKYKLDKDIS
ncbi:MAG: sigma-54-dependent Fis family transcriptional regulator [Deltaproteobacteria bacterium HGW-Deltaproteobacteria-21]|nr:MAG: sigma-54-dependent Fis family transcriptional regulator [Deltaproteobacteria bacterium HGW-Deltaproteobacteria-21]